MDPYEVLGVTPQATLGEVTAAYRTMAQIFHPDRFAGAPENVRSEAERRMVALNQAYSMIRTGAAPSASASRVAGPQDAQRRAAEAARARQRERSTRMAAREHQSRLRAARAARMQAEQTASQAVARPKGRGGGRTVLSGMGKALRTNEVTCRGCRGIQRLPPGWQDDLDHTDYFCSVCGRLLFARS